MFDRICAALSLGTLTAPPVRLTGGYMHRMFRLTTEQGDYAVKLLNPEVMARPGVLENYRAAEGYEALLEAAGLPILPAKTIHGHKMHCVDGQHLYVFDYYAGHVLPDSEITPAHCAKIGAALAGIQGAAKPSPSAGADSAPGGKASWCDLAEALLAAAETCAVGALLKSAVPLLAKASAAAAEAARRLPPQQALCHNDMDPKNVLWQGADFRIIDLECLGLADPRQELLDLAISWGGGDEARFRAFVSAYVDAGGVPLTDADLVYDSRRNYLDWLAYNAKRALADDPEERKIAREQIAATVEKIRSDAAMRETVLGWLHP